MTVSYIYALVDPREPDIIRYIGKSINPRKRLYSHIFTSKNSRTHRDCWIKSLIEINISPKILILEECSTNNDYDREIYWISMYKSSGTLTNHTDGGEGLCGYKYTEDQKIALRKRLAGHKVSARTIEKLIERNKSRSGIKMLDEQKDKISKSLKGRKHSKEHSEKVGLARKGKKHSADTKAKMSRAHAKLKEFQVIKIHEMIALQKSDSQIAESFNVSRKTINDIKLGRTWARITGITR